MCYYNCSLCKVGDYFLIEKETTFKVIDVEIYDSLTKEASEGYDPDFLHLWVRAISAGEYWGCFPEGQMVLMGDGSWKDIKDVAEGELVYTPYGNVKPVMHKFEKDYDGYIHKLLFTKVRTELVCTPNHEFLTVLDSDLRCLHDKYVKCLPQYSGKRNICKRRYTHCDCVTHYNEKWVSATDLNIGDYVGYRSFHQEADVLSNEAMYFIGLYLAEGSIVYPKRGRNIIQMSFGYHEKDTIVKLFLEDIAPKIGIEKIKGPYLSESKGMCTLVIYDDYWFEFFEANFGRYSYGKYIPEGIKSSSNVNYLLQGFIDGDGHIDASERVTVTTVSDRLGRDLFDIAINIGCYPSYVVHKESREELKDRVRDRHQITFSARNREVCNIGIKKVPCALKQDKSHSFIFKNKFYSKLSDKKLIKFSGKVYNLEVADDNCYIVNGISSHNSNKNADYFSEKELKEWCHTFLDAKCFKNHENKMVEKAIGDVLEVKYNDNMHYVELLIRIDRKLAPEIVRGFEKGLISDVSMGCKVKQTQCSVCFNIAKTRKDFCEHVRTMRNEVMPNGIRVVEFNHEPKFHDISVVLRGADRTAKVLEFVNTNNKQQQKAAYFLDNSDLEKVASFSSQDEEVLDNLLKDATITNKVAEIKKEIKDKLYFLAFEKRRRKNTKPTTPEETEKVVEAVEYFSGLLKEALPKRVPVPSLFNWKGRLAGAAGLAGLSSYFQGKRLRGEQTNKVENFMADNPSLPALAYFVGAKAAYKGAYRGLNKQIQKVKPDPNYNPFEHTAEMSDAEFEKFANDYRSLEKVPYLDLADDIDIFRDSAINKIAGSTYDADKLHMIKLALIANELGKIAVVDEIKNKFKIEDSDLSNFLKIALRVIESKIEKEAAFMGSVLRNMVEDNFFARPGFTAAALPATIIDGVLFTKLMGTDADPKKFKQKGVNEVKNKIEPLRGLNNGE